MVRPLAAASRGLDRRAEAAAEASLDAERSLAEVQAALAGRTRLEDDLERFYDDILPDDLPAARRLTYTSLPALAQEAGVQYVRRRFDLVPASGDRRLNRLSVEMELHGRYENLRRFVDQVERSSDFIVIDAVSLTERGDAEPLALSISLSTYFRPPGS